MNFETVIGLEVHVELNTNSKIFSPTSAHFGNEQNANTNVIDWSFPGVLPVLNKGVVDAGIKAALALNMDIHQHMHFDRKNYFYPDNPKAYQISQFDEPIGYKGWIEVQLEDGSTKKIGIERAHLEEDAGKNTHSPDGFSYVDLNRQGVPLIEIVSEADMRSPEEAYAYLTALKEVIQYTGISDVKMEEGSMRVDANISLRPYGQEEFGTKTELKNLNSFSNVRKGLEYEVQRQAKILRSGGVIRQETRRYDEAHKSTILMRVKEGAADYRYFPEPDLPLFEISDEWIEEMRTELAITPLGLFWGLFSAVTYALYILLPAKAIEKWGSLIVIGLGMLLGGLIFPIAIQAWKYKLPLTGGNLLALFGLVFIGTVFAYTVFLKGTTMVGAVKGSLLASVEPVASVILTVLIMGDHFFAIDVLGMILIVLAVIIISLKDLVALKKQEKIQR